MPEVGDEAPNFKLVDSHGKVRQLTDFRGNYILLDFWASWCGPCRSKHQTMFRIYEQTKGKKTKDGISLQIISVSLDTDSSSWMRAINNDHMMWDAQFCDFQKWESPVVENYGLSYLPYNFLLDSQGVVVAKGMSTDEMEKTCIGLFD